MSKKRPKLHIEIDPAQCYPYIRNQLKAELEQEFPDNPEAVDQQLYFSDELYKLEMDIQEVTYIVNKKILAAEDNALNFLGNHPERIPTYIQRLTTAYNNWQQQVMDNSDK